MTDIIEPTWGEDKIYTMDEYESFIEEWGEIYRPFRPWKKFTINHEIYTAICLLPGYDFPETPDEINTVMLIIKGAFEDD